MRIVAPTQASAGAAAAARFIGRMTACNPSSIHHLGGDLHSSHKGGAVHFVAGLRSADWARRGAVEDVGWELFRMILEVASGTRKPWSDQWGLYNALALFNPAPVT